MDRLYSRGITKQKIINDNMLTTTMSNDSIVTTNHIRPLPLKSGRTGNAFISTIAVKNHISIEAAIAIRNPTPETRSAPVDVSYDGPLGGGETTLDMETLLTIARPALKRS